jgi:hypothetical protein
MIIGMMASMLLMVVAVNLLNAGFFSFAQDVVGDPSKWTMLKALLFIIAYGTIVLIVANKVFSLIHIVPERVITWIGGHGVQYGEAEAEGKLKHGVEAGAQQIGGAAKEAKAGAEKADSGMEKGFRDYKKKQDGGGNIEGE